MTTFQAIIYAAIQGISQFLPISPSAHRILIPYLVGWQPPSSGLLSALTVGSLLALLIYFRHDWASMISSLLQVILFRKRPMTMDERLPLFIGVSCLPFILSSYYFHERIQAIEWTPVLVAGILATIGLPLWVFDYLGRKTKNMYDWNWLDATLVGFIQSSAIIPGWSQLTGVLLGALFLNYRRESAAKYAYFTLAPPLFLQTMSGLKEVNFWSSVPSTDLSWLSFGVAAIVSCLVGLLTIGGFMKHVQQKSFNQYIIYRWILAAAVISIYWLKNR